MAERRIKRTSVWRIEITTYSLYSLQSLNNMFKMMCTSLGNFMLEKYPACELRMFLRVEDADGNDLPKLAEEEVK